MIRRAMLAIVCGILGLSLAGCGAPVAVPTPMLAWTPTPTPPPTVAPTATPVPAIIHVDLKSSGSIHDGRSWASAFTDLDSALRAAQPGDEIWVAAGVYTPGPGAGQGGDARSATFTLKEGVALYGGFAGTETGRDQRNWTAHLSILSGDIDGNDRADPDGVLTDTANIRGKNAFHVVTAGGVSEGARLDGFVITAGYASRDEPDLANTSGYGGGMVILSGSKPALANLTFSANKADKFGGGIVNGGEGPAITDSTFSRNTAVQGGGGLYNAASSPALTNVKFDSNTGGYGGGMLNAVHSSPVLTRVAFHANHAPLGGGGMFNDSSSPILTDVTFSANDAVNGGGMLNLSDSNPSLTNVTFDGNTAPRSGGGMFNDTSSPVLTDVAFLNNSAEYGGGMTNGGSSNSTLTNVIFFGNGAQQTGGAIYNYNSSPSLTNVTIYKNRSQLGGGGLVNVKQSKPSLANTIIWANANALGRDKVQVGNDKSSLPLIAYSDIQYCGGSGARWIPAVGADGGGNIDADPLFVDGATGVLQLRPGSPAIDTGSNRAVPAAVTADLDGKPRIAGTTVDMGAYETGK